jgi:hypothetical protein
MERKDEHLRCPHPDPFTVVKRSAPHGHSPQAVQSAGHGKPTVVT